ncbi:hypothetical protein SLOPH_959 [Spraguea lophii 42_110]|uniref:Uncharacterized protein n=1 Tax=Spraguea lophii (strain 42_110) TaxID=1358809 RepID=S7W7W0_SPRLO|nr:hypothetical protein SLOPH_959 [Spraguea lophii 42_110]
MVVYENLIKGFCGQGISICFAAYLYLSGYIDNNCWLFTKLCTFFILLIIANSIIIVVRGAKKGGTTPFLKIFIVSLTEVLINAFMLLAIDRASLYYVVAISQLGFPISVVYKKYIRKEKEDITLYKLLAFIFIIVFCFFISYFSYGNLKITFLATLFVLLSNITITIDLYLQFQILQNYDVNYYSVVMAAFAIPITLVVSFIVDKKNAQMPIELFKYYTKHWMPIIGFGAALTLVYAVSPFFIKKYSPISFQASLLSNNCYIGLCFILVSMDKTYFKRLIKSGAFFTKDSFKRFDKIFYILLYLICLGSSFYLTYSTEHRIKKIEKEQIEKIEEEQKKDLKIEVKE